MEHSKHTNPLQKYFRQFKTYLKLPSGTTYYDKAGADKSVLLPGFRAWIRESSKSIGILTFHLEIDCLMIESRYGLLGPDILVIRKKKGKSVFRSWNGPTE